MAGSGESSVVGDLIPLERELRERLAWFIRLRWLAAAGIVIGAWGATTFIVDGLSPRPMYAVGASVACYNVAFLLAGRRQVPREATTGQYRTSALAQIGLDWAALISLVHFAGGIQSPVTLAFAPHLIIAAILLSPRACYLLAGAASLLVGVLVAAEHAGVLERVSVIGPPLNMDCGVEVCVYRWLVLTAFFGVTALLTTSIVVPLRRKEEALVASERALDQAYGEMEALYELGQTVNATLDLDQVLGLIAANAAGLMRMKACSIRLLEPDGQHLRVGAAHGLSPEYLDKGPVEVTRSRLDAEALAGRTVQVADAASDPRFQYPEEARREGIRAVLCVPLRAKGRSIGCMRVYSGDVHQFTRREENFLRNLANLGAVAIENARDYAALQVLSEERAWFARVTHHQLRAPLAAVKSMLDALRFAGPLNDKQAELIERSRRRADELLDMIRDLLELAAAQRPMADRRAEPVVLAGALEAPLETARDRAAHKDLELEVALDPGLTVLAESGDVERILANLLDNAVKYTPPGGRVSLRSERDGDRVVTSVRDTGIGIKPEDQERIFEGFFRSEEARSSGEIGTGMGLSIVRRLVERWGGELSLESRPGAGSVFTVRLPAVAGGTPAT